LFAKQGVKALLIYFINSSTTSKKQPRKNDVELYQVAIEDFERQQEAHGQQLAAVYNVVKRLIAAPRKPKRKLGFQTE
jgi:hypothetical protein